MKLLIAAALALAVCSPAFADANTVSAPWGNWVSAGIEQVVLPILAAVLLALLTWAAKFLPASLRAYATTKNTAAVEQLLEKAISFGLKKVAGASAGQSLTLTLGSDVLAQAAQYAIDHGPGWLLDWAGGEDGIRQKILARLDIDPATDGAAVLAHAAPAIT